MTTFKNAIEHFPEYNGNSSFCCGDAGIDNNCAHLVSYALDAAGFSIKKGTPDHIITKGGRCSNKMPFRAHDVKRWIEANTAATAHSEFPPEGKYAFFYNTSSNHDRAHVGFCCMINGQE